MLIRNFGLFWDREKVHWGKHNNAGVLSGVHGKQKKGGIVDFREQMGIYALYDSAFNLLYVGQTGSGDQRLLKRLHNHQADHLSQRWKYFSWFGLCYVKMDNSLSEGAEHATVKADDALNHLEAIAIAISEPKLNLQRGRFGDDCEQYIQDGEEEDA